MGRFVSARWEPDPAALGPRRARVGGHYRPFIPDPLQGLPVVLPGAVAADVADAERAMLELQSQGSGAGNAHRLEPLARLLLRAEAVASSQIEGLHVSPRRLALAEFGVASAGSDTAHDVVGNIRALSDALALGATGAPITIDALCAIHATLMAGTRAEAIGGLLRRTQNWIGGYSPLDASFVPPPPDNVPALLEDLCAYANGSEHSPLVQAAVVHAWFETIHPFADGNGRTGRALLHVILRRRGLCKQFVPPLSLVLATRSDDYIRGLTGLRLACPPTDPAFTEALASWLEFIAQCTRLACTQLANYEAAISALVESWRAQVLATCGPLRADAATWVLLAALPAAPLVTTQSAVTLTGRSERAVEAGLAHLLRAGVVKQVGGRVRYRLYEAVGVFDLVAGTERALASPAGDTRVQPPNRPVPARGRR